MKQSQAVKVAITSMEKEVHALAIDANLFDLVNCRTPGTRRASERRKELKEACAVLRGERQVEMKL